jgi:hypothetical protein
MTTIRRPWDRQRTLVLLALATGHSRAAPSAKAGIADRTLRRWVADDEAFAEAIEVAMGEGRAVYEELLRAAGQKDWRAALAAYEVINLGGTRGNKAEATATLIVTAPRRRLTNSQTRRSRRLTSAPGRSSAYWSPRWASSRQPRSSPTGNRSAGKSAEEVLVEPRIEEKDRDSEGEHKERDDAEEDRNRRQIAKQSSHLGTLAWVGFALNGGSS